MVAAAFWLRRATLCAERQAAAGQIRFKSSSSSRRGGAAVDSSDDEIDRGKRVVKVSDETCSYGIRKIKQWIKERDVGFTYRVRRIVDPMVNTGMVLDFPFGMSLSMETHPSVCVSDFVESCIMPTMETIEDPTYMKDLESPRLILLEPLGYSEKDFVMRHKEAEDLFDHIVKFRRLLLKAIMVDGVVELANGDTIDMRPVSQIKAEKAKAVIRGQVPILVKSDWGPSF